MREYWTLNHNGTVSRMLAMGEHEAPGGVRCVLMVHWYEHHDLVGNQVTLYTITTRHPTAPNEVAVFDTKAEAIEQRRAWGWPDFKSSRLSWWFG